MPVSNSIDHHHLKHVDEINFSHFDLLKLARKRKWSVPSPCSQPKRFLRLFGLQHRSRIYKAHSLFYNPVQKTLSSLHGAEVYLQQRMKIMANKQKLSTYKQTLPVRGRGKPELNWTCHKFMVLPLSIQSTLQKHITLLQISTFFAV